MKLLLHCCCGPCSTACIQRLLDEGWQVVLYFGNSNIDTQEENQKRFNELLKVAKIHDLEVIRGPYNHDSWLKFIRGLEGEPEHGKRCVKCFEYNLLEASLVAKELGIEHFTTSLSVSRFKNSKIIFSVGQNFDGFECIDFKKKNGFSRSCQLAKELGLYRQDYCGCEFSKNK